MSKPAEEELELSDEEIIAIVVSEEPSAFEQR